MKSRLLPSFIVSFAVAALLAATAWAEESATTIKFSDSSKPGTVKISLGRGSLRIQGGDAPDVSLMSDAKPEASRPRKDGLRVISSAASFSVNETNNVITIDAAGGEFGKNGTNMRLTVPRNTTVMVQNAWGGDITCTGINGDLDINSMQGEITLEDVSGGVIVGTLNGRVRATIRELREGKPLSFTSMNGEVVVRIPENSKANVRLRTQNGSVLTDFDETALVTKTETVAGSHRVYTLRNNKVLTQDIQDAIREATQLSAGAIREALEAIKSGLDEAKLDNDDARRQFEDARRAIDRARREADRERRENERRNAEVARDDTSAAPSAPAAPSAKPGAAAKAATAAKPVTPPMPPRVPVPTITGGKLVSGTLNGGGPEINISTMNGDVTLRKIEAGK